MEAGEAASDPSVVCECLWVMAVIFAYQGAWDEAAEHAQRAIDAGPTPADKAWAQFVLAWARARRSPEASIQAMKPLEEVIRTAGEWTMVPWIWVGLGEALTYAGQKDEGMRTLRDAVELSHRLGMKYQEACAHRLLGEALIEEQAQDTTTSAELHLTEALKLFQYCKAQPDVARTYAGLGELKWQQGNSADACSHLQTALEISEQLGMIGEPQRVRRLIEQFSAA